MINPPVEELLEKVECKYTLVVVASRRARQLINDREITDRNPVSVAIDEIISGKVTYKKYCE